MTPFSERDTDRHDWELLQDGAVTLYWRREIFDRDTAWLTDHGYRVHVIDCADAVRFRDEMTRVLRFKENYGYEPWTGNLDALNDAFRDIDFDSVSGVAFAFVRFDMLAAADREAAQAILDIIESSSRDYLLFGYRLLALVQTDNPQLAFDPIGARTAKWNREEWLDAKRGRRQQGVAMGTLTSAKAADRSIVVLDVPWSGYAKTAIAVLEAARGKLKDFGVTLAVVDEESADVREWLNEHATESLGGEHARGAGSLLWLENGAVVDIQVDGYNLSLHEVLVRTRERWGAKGGEV